MFIYNIIISTFYKYKNNFLLIAMAHLLNNNSIEFTKPDGWIIFCKAINSLNKSLL